MEFLAEREAIGRAIAEERKRQNLTQSRLALMAEINEGYLCEIEKGIANATINKLLAIAKALGIALADLHEGV